MRETPSLRFASFRLDLGAEQLWRGEEARPLTRKAFAALCYLVVRAGQLVTKDELIAAVWAVPYVSDMALAACIREIRRALEEQAQAPRFVETVRGRGYRFLAAVTAGEPSAATAGMALRTAALAGALVPETPHERPSTTLVVAREAELHMLHQRFVQACAGTRQVVFVTGEAGIGKTTLVDAFVGQVAPTEPVWLGRGQCIEPHGAGEPYLPLLEALGRLGRAPDGARVVTLFYQYAPSWLLHLPALVPEAEAEALQRRAGGATRERMLRELAEAVEALTTEQPLVLVLEDLHWSDDSTLDWLAYVAQRRGAARLLILGTYRSGEVLVRAHPVRTVIPELQIHGHCIELVLAYLSAAGVTTYLAQRFGAPAVPEGLAPVLHERTNGNPLFLIAVVDDLVRRGLVRTGAGGWELSEDLEVVTRGVPESLRQLLEQQFEQLSLDDQRLLEAASVVGVEFAAAAVAAGVDTALEVVEARCAAFARRGQFIRPRGTDTWPDGTVTERYGFVHALYHEAFYDQIPASRKRRWHLQIGTRKETAYGTRAREIAAELAVHFVQGRGPQRAVRYLQYAGENALQRSANLETISHLTKGREILKTLPDTPQRSQQELDMLTILGPALVATRGFAAPDVETVYTRARELCQQVGETPRRFPVLAGLRLFYTQRAEYQIARALGEQLLSLAQRAQDPALLPVAHQSLGVTLTPAWGVGASFYTPGTGETALRSPASPAPCRCVWPGSRGSCACLMGLWPCGCLAIRPRRCSGATTR